MHSNREIRHGAQKTFTIRSGRSYRGAMLQCVGDWREIFMADNQPLTATPEENQQMVEAFAKSAIPQIISAAPVTRFVLTNNPFSQNPVLVMGNSLLVEVPGIFPKAPLVNVVAAVSLAKNVAEDLIVSLERSFGVTEADLQAARDRNPLPGQAG